MKPTDYVVGKGRPPRGTRWKPGQSGNPKGRPKGVKNMMTYFHEALNRKIDVKIGGKIRTMSAREGIAMNTTNLALKRDVKIIPLVLAIKREVSVVMERKKIQTITDNTSPEEALELFRSTLRGED